MLSKGPPFYKNFIQIGGFLRGEEAQMKRTGGLNALQRALKRALQRALQRRAPKKLDERFQRRTKPLFQDAYSKTPIPKRLLGNTYSKTPIPTCLFQNADSKQSIPKHLQIQS